MIPMTLSQIAHVVGGSVHGDPDAVIYGPVVVDSRRAEPGSLFLAFVGEVSDGHNFASAAHEAGAVASMVQRVVEGNCVLVEDPLAALAALARWLVQELRSRTDLRVIALTGSQGKTSVKDLVAHICAAEGPTVAPEGSFNNELGVPLTILRADLTTRWLILEMGARGAGHISYLCSIVRPDVAAVLNVGTAHMGEFGSVAGIAAAKGEILQALGSEGIAVINADDPNVATMSTNAATVVSFGTDADVSLAQPVTLDAQGHAQIVLRYRDRDWPVTIPQIGFHHGINAAAAFAMAVACTIAPESIARALSTAVPRSAMRMEAVRAPDGMLILNDAYNANPESMAAALHTLVGLAPERAVAVLGPMLELGAESHAKHLRVGELAADLGVDLLVVVGAAAGGIASGAGDMALMYESVDEAIRTLKASLRPSDTVLVKASRSIKLEKLVAALVAA